MVRITRGTPWLQTLLSLLEKRMNLNIFPFLLLKKNFVKNILIMNKFLRHDISHSLQLLKRQLFVKWFSIKRWQFYTSRYIKYNLFILYSTSTTHRWSSCFLYKLNRCTHSLEPWLCCCRGLVILYNVLASVRAVYKRSDVTTVKRTACPTSKEGARQRALVFFSPGRPRVLCGVERHGFEPRGL